MPHEYDDPISPEAIEHAAQLAHRRWGQKPNTTLNDHVEQAVHETFCACATSIEDSIEGRKSGVHAAIEEAVKTRTIELNSNLSDWDEVDEASDASFPASDPPAWIHKGYNQR